MQTESLKNKLTKIITNEYFDYVWLFFLSIICFGLLILELGFYWDDLPYLYQFAAFGPAGFPEFVSSDRPFSAWIFSATTSLFGFNPTGYHILALFLRWGCTVLFYLILQQIWINNRTGNLIAASIFAVYPGFLQQPIALIYNHHLSIFAMFLLSIYLMVLNEYKRKRNLFLSAFSILLSLGMFSIENFVTLEFIRPVILWRIHTTKQPEEHLKQRLLCILKVWSPYLLILFGFVYWRVILFKFPTYQPTFLFTLSHAPLAALENLLKRIPIDLYTILFGAWLKSFHFPTISDFGSTATYALWILVAGSFLSTAIIFINRDSNHQKERRSHPRKHPANGMILSGLFLFLLSASIPWVLDLPLLIEFAWDRLTIAFLPAAALIIAGILGRLERTRIIHGLLISLLICFAVGSHFENSMKFKRDWEELENFISQLSWRIPSLEKNTLLIASDVGLNYYSDNSLTSPVNLMYSENLSKSQIDFMVYYTDARSDDWFKNKDADREYIKSFRSFEFNGHTSDIVAFLYSPPGCLKVLDRKSSNSITNANLSIRQTEEIPFSSIDRIKLSPENQPFSQLFNFIPTDTWCYYFEKADLARQFRDYQEIVRLGDEASSANLSPRVASEWLPFLEGYAWTGDWEQAEEIIVTIQNAEGNFTNGMCYTLKKIQKEKNYPFIDDLSLIISKNCQ